MDPDTTNPAKKPRSLSGNKLSANLKVVECIREFKLPQAFPSMAKYQKSIGKNMTVQKITLPTSSITLQRGHGSPNDMKLTNKLQKVKLKSPDGRHLGEFDVQILPQVNNNTRNKSISSLMNTPLKINETIVNIEPDSDRPQFNAPFKLEREEKFTHGVAIPIKPNLIRNSNDDQHQLQTVHNNCKNNKTYVVQAGNNWQVLKFGDEEKNNVHKITSTPIMMKSLHNNEIGINSVQVNSPNRGNVQNVLLKNSSIFKAVENSQLKTVKLINSGNSQFKPIMMNRADNVSTVRTSGTKRPSNVSLMRRSIKEKKLTNLMYSDSSDMNVGNVNENGDDNPQHNLIALSSINGNGSGFDEKNNTKNNDVNSRQSYPLRNSHGTVNLIRRGKKDLNPGAIAKPNDRTTSPISNVISDNSSTDSTTINTSTNYLKNLDNLSSDDMSSRLSIVGQALSMISDDELRTKALQALADCGIGIERLVPVKPPLDFMSVKESQTQTSVFGILDPKNFIRVTGDTDIISLSRLQEMEQHIIVDDTTNEDKPSREIEKFSQELHKILNQRWVNKMKVERVKQILKVNPLVEKALNLMENDYKNANKYDNNGLLSIHRAVLSDQVRAVKRQLMVLRSCKQSIDLPTLNGKTALELGMKQAVSSEIINLLLKSGANPTSRQSAHDSALTIAANESSHFLSQLIKYVSSTGDLNNLDSDGFTALHYCVRNGNINGISALIRANADVNVRDLKSGRTPLFHALESDYLQIAKELLANGARANIPNFSGQTVFVIFDEEKHYSLKDALNKSVK